MIDTLLFEKISNLPTLKPTPKTNQLFFDLVHFCLNAQPEDITLSAENIAKLQQLSGEAEGEMELYWAKRIIASEDPNKELLRFWYYENYAKLVDLEYSCLSSFLKKDSNVLFIGGGPLPLTALLLSKKYGLQCTVLEKDCESSKLSKTLVDLLGLEKNITVVYKDALEYLYYPAHDAIYLAALAGNTEVSKKEIILSIYKKMRTGSYLLCRSSDGAKTLLYPPIPKTILKYLKPILEVKPTESIINSFIILQKT